MNARHRPTFASRLTRCWVRAYTAQLDPARRDTRRAELASDLWEHEAEAKRTGLGVIRTNTQILRRLLTGMPADLSWRHLPPDATAVPATTAPPVATMLWPPWLCRLRGHHYVTKRLENRLDDGGGVYRLCERCNHEKWPNDRPPAHWAAVPG
jgi:hypothetical protein